MKPAADTSEVNGSPAKGDPGPNSAREAWKHFFWFSLAAIALFAVPLYHLARLSLKRDLYSHLLLVPLITGYLIWIERKGMPKGGPRSWPLVITTALLAIVAVVSSRFVPPTGIASPALGLMTLGFVMTLLSGAGFFLGTAICKYCAYPFAILVFMVPWPTPMVKLCETGLQHASAWAADWFFVASRMPSVKEGLFFHLPGITLEVAPECSGLRSTLVLLIVSVVAAKMFLRTLWKRALLIMLIIPLGIGRNAFRIFTLGYLTVNVDPSIINSPLHHQGGPVFFLISLIPLNLILWLLYRSEPKVPVISAAQPKAIPS